jgi:hypothetical protein
MYVVLLVVYQKNYKRDVTDIWNQENINLIMFMMRIGSNIEPDWLKY